MTVNIDDIAYIIPALDNDHYFLGHHPTKQIIIIEVFSYLTSVQFRFICDALYNLICKIKIDRVLIDATMMPIIGLEDQHWLNEIWLPNIAAAGYGACAIVDSKYFFNRIAFDNILSRLDKDRFKIKTFAYRAQAEHWLTTMTQPLHQGSS